MDIMPDFKEVGVIFTAEQRVYEPVFTSFNTSSISGRGRDR